MHRWMVAVLVLLLGGPGLWPFGGMNVRAGFSNSLDLQAHLPQCSPESFSRDRAISMALIGDLSRSADPGPTSRQWSRAEFPAFSPDGSSRLLSPGAAPTLLATSYGGASQTISPTDFSRGLTVTLLAAGQQRFSGGGHMNDVTAKLKRPRAPINPTRLSQPTVRIDVRSPSSLVLAMIGCSCSLLWFAWQARFHKS
jgi:hypothetical protein